METQDQISNQVMLNIKIKMVTEILLKVIILKLEMVYQFTQVDLPIISLTKILI
ncbi:hypothetical protein D3C84_710300 [compost metagenome]